ncbi:hypothetical protein [uncultured Brevibacillus sp.]|uniref:hypothetical protein n=1 Tax=uncultured Brevibacillus sp. TaxID=169970 RepID=UPI002594465D|nr:hypothetical protein [uncultured Brevibacillus sp.]
MKKILSVSLLTASLLAGGTGIIHAEEQPAQEQKLNQTPEYQELQSLLTIKKDLNEKLKAQTTQNKAMWESVRSGVSEEVRAAVKNVMQEIKPIREAKKSNREEATQTKQQYKDKMKVTKEAYKNGDNTWSTSLTEAIDLLEQWTDIENEILSQKASIYDALQ